MLLYSDYTNPSEFLHNARLNMIERIVDQLPIEKIIELILSEHSIHSGYTEETLRHMERRPQLLNILSNIPDIIPSIGNEIIEFFDEETLGSTIYMFDEYRDNYDLDDYDLDELKHLIRELIPNPYEVIEKMFYEQEVIYEKESYYIEIIKNHLPSYHELIAVYENFMYNLPYITTRPGVNDEIHHNLIVKNVRRFIKILNGARSRDFARKIIPYLEISDIANYLYSSQNT